MSHSSFPTPTKQVLGVDVSSKELHCCLSYYLPSLEIKRKGQRKFDNTEAGRLRLYDWLLAKTQADSPLEIVMEATGVYHEALAYFLDGKGLKVCLLLPNRAKHYLRSLGLYSKNDKIDASGLATMGCQQQLPQWKPLSPMLYELRQLTRHVQALQTQQTRTRNQRHAILNSQAPVKEAISSLDAMIKMTEKTIDKLKESCIKLVEKDPKISKYVAHIESIKGMGTWAAIILIAETDGFTMIESDKQLTSYAGYDVVENQSGKRAGKTKISKKGNARIRRALLFPAFNVARYNQGGFTDFYERLVERGKPKMQAYVAIQRKLLVLAWTLCKKGEDFDPEHHLKEKKKDRTPKSPAQDT